MANWNKLNKELDEVLNSMSSEDWQSWAKTREQKKVMRKCELLLKAKLQEEKLLLSSSTGKNIISQNDLISFQGSIGISSITGIDYSGNATYAMAA